MKRRRRPAIALAVLCALACKPAHKEAETPVAAELAPGASAVLHVRWEYKGIPEEMRLHESTQADLELWAMGIVKQGQAGPIGKEIEDSDVQMKPGASRKFLLVYSNPTDREITFFAAPHSMHPPELSLGFKFHCLCINHVYVVPPRSRWYRMVSIDLGREFNSQEIVVSHALVQKDPVTYGR